MTNDEALEALRADYERNVQLLGARIFAGLKAGEFTTEQHATEAIRQAADTSRWMEDAASALQCLLCSESEGVAWTYLSRRTAHTGKTRFQLASLAYQFDVLNDVEGRLVEEFDLSTIEEWFTHLTDQGLVHG